MKKFYSFFSKSAFASMAFVTILASGSIDAKAADMMPEGQRVYPSGGSYVTYFSVMDLSWDYEPLELVNPSTDVNGYGYEYSTVPAKLSIEGIESQFDLYPFVYEVFLGYEETEDGDYDYTYGYVLSVDLMADDILGQLNLSEFPYGKYTINFPEGVVQNLLGDINPAQTVEITYMASPDFDTEVFTPPSIDENWQPIDYAADDLKAVSLTWNMPLTMNPESAPATVRQYSWIEETPRTPLIFGEDIVLNDQKDALIFDLSSLPVGRWSVEFPTAYVFLGEDKDMINEEVLASYTITTASGIEDVVKAKEGRWMVFDLKGVLLMDTKEVSLLKELAPGLYIINGEKVLIRK